MSSVNAWMIGTIMNGRRNKRRWIAEGLGDACSQNMMKQKLSLQTLVVSGGF